MDPLDQLLADFAAGGAARQQMLGAIDLGRLAQHRGTALRHQQIDRVAERRVGGDAAEAIAAAALERQHQLADRHSFRAGTRSRAAAARPAPAALPRSLRRRRRILDADVGRQAQVAQLARAGSRTVPRTGWSRSPARRTGMPATFGLRAKPASVRRSTSISGPDVARWRSRLVVRQADNIGDVREARQQLGPRARGDLAHGVGRTVDGADQHHRVARADAAVGAAVALERAALLRRHHVDRAHIDAELVVELHFADCQVLCMHVIPCAIGWVAKPITWP